MPDSNELDFMTIAELSGLIRKKKLSPVELTRHFLNRIKSLNGRLHAFISLFPKKAMKQAEMAEKAIMRDEYLGPLHGIPFAVKDLFDVKGFPTMAGTRLLNRNIAAKDACVVRRLYLAGSVLMGKTHTVQFAYSGIGINHDHGTPHNPWKKRHHVPGGSSSGSAVAVSSGMVPMALGTDTGGSVRIPASLCGVTGLKTTLGRVSRQGVYPLSHSMDSVGPITRSAEDTALVYQYLHGPDPEDPTTLGLPFHDALQNLKTDVKGLRVGYTRSIFWENIHRDVQTAFLRALDVFKNLGTRVEELDFPEAEKARELNKRGLIIAYEAYHANKKLLDDHFDQLDPVVSNRMIKGKAITRKDYQDTLKAWRLLRKKTEKRLQNLDAVLVPTTAIPARPVAEIDRDIPTYGEKNILYLRNTSVGNTLNLCGLQVPCGQTRAGLPVGLLIYGKSFQEDLVLRLGHAYQQQTPWHMRTPDLAWIE